MTSPQDDHEELEPDVDGGGASTSPSKEQADKAPAPTVSEEGTVRRPGVREGGRAAMPDDARHEAPDSVATPAEPGPEPEASGPVGTEPEEAGPVGTEPEAVVEPDSGPEPGVAGLVEAEQAVAPAGSAVGFAGADTAQTPAEPVDDEPVDDEPAAEEDESSETAEAGSAGSGDESVAGAVKPEPAAAPAEPAGPDSAATPAEPGPEPEASGPGEAGPVEAGPEAVVEPDSGPEPGVAGLVEAEQAVAPAGSAVGFAGADTAQTPAEPVDDEPVDDEPAAEEDESSETAEAGSAGSGDESVAGAVKPEPAAAPAEPAGPDSVATPAEPGPEPEASGPVGTEPEEAGPVEAEPETSAVEPAEPGPGETESAEPVVASAESEHVKTTPASIADADVAEAGDAAEGPDDAGAEVTTDAEEPADEGADSEGSEAEEPVDLPPSYPPTRRPRPLPIPGQEEDSASEARPRRSWLSTIVVVLVVIALSAFIKTHIYQTFEIPSGSMEDTLQTGDQVAVRMYDAHSIHRGDVVVFSDPGGWLDAKDPTGLQGLVRNGLILTGLLPKNSGHHLIKRVIGVAGDHITADGTSALSVNGVPLDETYVRQGSAPSSVPFDVVVPEGCVWVMGDNRSNSSDSRFHQDDPHGGAVPVTDVVGVATNVVWPVGHWDSLDDGEAVFKGVPDDPS